MSTILAALLVSANLPAAPQLGDFARDADGNLIEMNQPDAETYCRSIGSRLPTAQELALYSQSQGAMGIRETSYPSVSIADPRVQIEITDLVQQSFSPIYSRNDRGETVVAFYHAQWGYQAPAPYAQPPYMYQYIWSSTPDPDRGTGDFYSLGHYSGIVTYSHWHFVRNHSARCLLF